MAADVIRTAIAEGRLAAGQPLKEGELARDLGISRTPVREALRVLEAEGLVRSERNRTAFVQSYAAEEIADMYNLRALLEGEAAHRAAARISSDAVVELRRSCQRFAAVLAEDDMREIVKENMHFHGMILEAAGSERLTAMVRKVTELPLVYKSYVWYSPDQKVISTYAHEQITRACEARDADQAEVAMKQHLFEARDLVVDRLRAQEHDHGGAS